MIGRRRILAGIAATAAGAGIAEAPAAARPDPALGRLIADYLDATHAREATLAAFKAAWDRARARYPAALPEFGAWAKANHPEGKLDLFGPRATRTVEADRRLHEHMIARRQAAGSGPIETIDDPEIGRLQAAITAAALLDLHDHYAPLRPTYDRLQAERNAAIEAIDVEEGIAALRAADDVAYERRAAAHEALMGWCPVSWLDHAAKASAILRHPWNPEQIDESEADQIAADIEMLGGGAA